MVQPDICQDEAFPGGSAPGVTARDRKRSHQQALLTRRRCCHCAEVIPSLVILKSGACPRCGREVSVATGCGGLEVVNRLAENWKTWRWVIYPVTALAAGLTGWMPFVAALLRFVGLLFVHIFLVRRPILWLSPRRRMTTKFTLRLTVVSIAMIGLLIDVLMIPWPGVNAGVAAAVTFVSTAAYAEGALWFVQNRIRREVDHTRLDSWEWMVPMGLVGSLVAVVGGGIAVLGLAVYTIKEAGVPLLSDLLGGLF